MKKTTAILVFSLFVSLSGLAQTVQINSEEPTAINAVDGRPITINTNFQIKSAELLLTDETAAGMKLFEKGLVIVPSKVGAYRATVVIEARDGTVYNVDFNAGDSEGAAVFKLEDQMQGFAGSEGDADRYESNAIDSDAKNIIKSVLLGEKITGFEKTKAPRVVPGAQFDMMRSFRNIGNKYIADEWILLNKTNETISFREEDFYTNGILAVALEKNRLLPGEKGYLVLLISKSAIFNANKGQ